MREDETFTDDQVIQCIEEWLAVGERACVESRGEKYGCFQGNGWYARCLRWHLEQLEKAEKEMAS